MVLISNALVGLVAILSFGFVDAFWRMVCGTIQTGRIDPIISPGGISGHCHTLAGPNNLNTTSTYASLQNAYCTSCEVQKDKSGYWTPQLYYKHRNGSFEEVQHGGTVVYYEGRGVNRTNIVPFPPGFRVLSGNSGARSYDNVTMTYGNSSYAPRPVADRVSFACLDSSGPSQEQPYLWRTKCDSGLRAQIQFQSCWDGVNLYKSDQSHVAYMSQIDNGVCPPTHPYQLIHLFFEVLYAVDNIDQSDGGLFVFGNGDTTGYGFHGDFLNGWDMDVQTAAIAQCANTDSGAISACPPLAASDDPYFNVNCPEQPPLVNESVHGMLKALPGCNPVTGGPQAAAQNICPVQPSINYVPAANLTRVVPTPGLKVGSWSYVGCSYDQETTRALPGASYSSTTNMTIESCTAFCKTQGYPLAGIEYQSQCFCGSLVDPTQPILPNANCSTLPFMTCSGNGLEYCGAPSMLQVWNDTSYTGKVATGPPSPGITTLQLPSSGSALYKGCYQEGSGVRALSGSTFSNSTGMTLETCAAFCQQGKYSLFGTEYSVECYCANTITTPSVAEGNCSQYCSGDHTEYCGAGSRLSVWSLNYTNFQPPSSTTSKPLTTLTTVLGVATAAVGTIPTTLSTQTSASAALPSSAIKITVAGGSGVYLGCVSETNGARALGGASLVNSTMTNDQCAAFCQKQNYALFGTEYFTQCFCGYSLASGSSQLASSSCSAPCKGNSSQICGGANAISLYNNTLFVPPRNPNPATVPSNTNAQYSYVGCYTDAGSARALGATATSSAYSTSNSAMTVEICAAVCFSKGYSWMGVEYASECYCNQQGPTNGATLAVTGDAECNKLCSGDNTEWCGGSSRINVYQKKS